jgi:hypothetical protein
MAIVLWNKLEGVVSGSVVSEVGPDFAATGNPLFAACKYNNGFNAVSADCLKTATNPAYGLTEGTIEIWYKLNTTPSAGGVRTFFDFQAGSDRIFAYMTSSTSCDLGIFYPSQQYYTAGFTIPDDTNLHHLAVCWSESAALPGSATVAVYIDGTLAFSDATAITNTMGASQFFIVGDIESVSNNLDGIVDNVKITNVAKSNFADRWHEDGVTTGNRPIFWSKLEDLTAEIGNDLIEAAGGSSDFTRAAKFNNGAWGGVSNWPKLEPQCPTDIARTGCIEFWVKWEDPEDTTSVIPIFFMHNPGVSAGSVSRQKSSEALVVYWVNSALFSVTHVQTAGVLAHIALSWDLDNPMGGTDYVRLYVDGVAVGAHTSAIPPYEATQLNLSHSYDDAVYSRPWVVFDNAKIFAYAKTDFADRFYEDGVIPTVSNRPLIMFI